jgi:hypothetical protein
MSASNNDEPAYMPLPEPYHPYGTRATNSEPAAPTASAQNATADVELSFMPHTAYHVANEMGLIEQLRQRVLELMGAVSRAAVGSPERLKAERDLITARSNLLTAARARESQVEAQAAALRKPGANPAELSPLESEVRSLRALIRVLEEEEHPSKAATTKPAPATNETVIRSWTNAAGERVEETSSGLRVRK